MYWEILMSYLTLQLIVGSMYELHLVHWKPRNTTATFNYMLLTSPCLGAIYQYLGESDVVDSLHSY